MQPKKIRWRVTLLPAIGALLAAAGAVLAICFDDIFQAILAQQLKLSPSSKSFPIWKAPTIPIFFDIYFFNWTNPINITDKNVKPHFVEMGPYRFRETKEKVNVTWNNENSTVSYRQMRKWYFDEEGSKGTLDDNITTLNAIAASAVYTSRYWNYIRQKGLSMGLTIFNQEISVTKTARELLFDGYDDPLLDLAKSLPQKETNAPPVDKFGWFYKRNGSTENDGYFNMATGYGNIKSFGVLKNWNNNTRTPFFSGSCAKVEGSAGEFYPPKLSKTQKISMFSADLCRTITFDYDEVVTVQGIPAYKYSGGSSILDNGTIHPENKCFCAGECQPSGTLNVSTCRYGSPAFISFPHFYLADPYYLDAIEGLSPDEDKHKFYIALEPTSGIPVDVAARFQLNFLVSPSNYVTLYNDVPHIFLPVLWFEQHVTVNAEIADGVKSLLKVPMMGNAVGLGLFALGIIIILWSPVRVNVKACRRLNRRKKDNPVPKIELEKSKPILNNMRAPKQHVNVLPSVEDQDEDEKDEEVAVVEPLNSVNNDLKKE
ncbi:protein peste-like [Arctopsyche grandis]|uniref:protein peste-like n=1 Tax=Arctopsyche grandis TaxID=121162 RepID=UPI00406D8F87